MAEKAKFVKGSKPTTQVEIIKMKNENTPTIIKVFGMEYVARPEGLFKGVGK